MKNMTAVTFCTLLLTAYSIAVSIRLNSNGTTTMSGKVLRFVGTNRRVYRGINQIKVQSTESYISFMYRTSFLCCGVLVGPQKAISVRSCGEKLISHELGNVTAVIGTSRDHDVQPIAIEDAYPIEFHPRLYFILFEGVINENYWIKRAPVRPWTNIGHVLRTGPYNIIWRADLNKYFSEDVQSQRQGAYIYSRLPRNHIQLCQQDFDSYLIFEDGVIKGCSFDQHEIDPTTGNTNEKFIRYEPIPENLIL